MSTLVAIFAFGLAAAPALAQSRAWYDQCVVIDTWYPQAGYGFDHLWHPEVYPVAIIETSYSVGTPADYAVCSTLVANSGGRYADHNHSTRPWDYMTTVCLLYNDAYTRIVTYVPQPVNYDTWAAYATDCNNSGGTVVYAP